MPPPFKKTDFAGGFLLKKEESPVMVRIHYGWSKSPYCISRPFRGHCLRPIHVGGKRYQYHLSNNLFQHRFDRILFFGSRSDNDLCDAFVLLYFYVTRSHRSIVDMNFRIGESAVQKTGN
jgi:hypothetical protein